MKPSKLAAFVFLILALSASGVSGQQAADSVVSERVAARCEALNLAHIDLADMMRSQAGAEFHVADILTADANQSAMACEASRQLLVVVNMISPGPDRQRVAAYTKQALDYWSKGEDTTIRNVNEVGAITRTPALAQAAQALTAKIRAFQKALPANP